MQVIGLTALGTWLLRVDDNTMLEFDSELEAVQAMSKMETAKAIVGCVKTLTTVMDTGPDLWQEYFDVVAASGAYADADVAALGITAADVISCVTLLDNMKKFFGNEAVAQDAYRVIVNKVRRVPV